MNLKYSKLHILIILYISFIFVSCDDTENANGIINTFFNPLIEGADAEKITNYHYYDNHKISMLNAQFNASSNYRPWDEFSNNLGKGVYADNEFQVSSKEGIVHFLRDNLGKYNQSKDFQIEMAFQCQFPTQRDEYYAGLACGQDKDGKADIGIYCKSIGATNDAYYIIVVDTKSNTVLHSAIPPINVKSYPILTFSIRKVGDKISFFFNEQLIGISQFEKSHKANVSYSLSEKSYLHISRLTIDYLK